MIRARTLPLAALLAAFLPGACSESQSSPATPTTTLAPASHSGPIAIREDGSSLYVVHPDADVVTIVDTATGATVQTLTLASGPPSVDPATGHYYPKVEPRALALTAGGKTLFVTGERSGQVFAFDAETGASLATTHVCAEPIGIVVDQRAENVFVACSQDDTIVELRASDLSQVATVTTPHKPWSLAWAGDGTTLLSTHLLGWGDAAADHPKSSGLSSPGITAFSTSPLAMKRTWPIVDGPARDLSTVPHGQVRGVYDAMVRPGTSELWTLHFLLGTDTSQPDLDFQSTIFPAITLLDEDGGTVKRLTVSTTPGDGAAIGDVVSGPRAIAFSADGAFVYVVDVASEDLLILDARTRAEVALVRPLPGHQPEGVVVGLHGKVYVQERNTEDIAVVDVGFSFDAGFTAVVEPNVLGKLESDPMPKNLRLGQHLFNSADSDEYPLTSNHWVSCTSCHLEGRSDAVTWKFKQGPRDTPSNAGGVLETGFLFRTADRNSVTDYWQTINNEQGGDFRATEPTQMPLLEALRDYVNDAIALPVPPTADSATAALVVAGRKVFEDAHCSGCHSGSAMTDSGMGNPSLDLSGPIVQTLTPGGVLLHSVGTCVTTPYPDVAHETISHQKREACLFDTPTLLGLSDSAPYLHDGSALTLEDAVDAMLAGAHLDPSGKDVPLQLAPADKAALVAYLKSN